jgi:hypothetical protein
MKVGRWAMRSTVLEGEDSPVHTDDRRQKVREDIRTFIVKRDETRQDSSGRGKRISSITRVYVLIVTQPFGHGRY